MSRELEDAHTWLGKISMFESSELPKLGTAIVLIVDATGTNRWCCVSDGD